MPQAVRRHAGQALASGAAVACVSGLVYALRPVAPTLSLGVLYVLAVLPVAVLFGIGYAIAVSAGSMLAFNFLFLPPVHTFALQDTRNWVALGVYVGTAVVVSELATRERRRVRQAVEAEALRRSDAMKTTLLRAVSHDLRSPLTAIRAAVDGLRSGAIELAPAERAAQLETIRLEARRLERLVANLLDLSKLEAGAAEPHRELWTVDDVIGRALDDLGPDSARIEVRVPAELPPIAVDGGQIELVLVNLLDNALKFTPATGAVAVVAEETRGTVTIRVADSGPGLGEDERARIFEPFERGAAAAGRGGTGLGLAIARGFAVANGGRLDAPRSDHGAVFELALPTGPPR